MPAFDPADVLAAAHPLLADAAGRAGPRQRRREAEVADQLRRARRWTFAALAVACPTALYLTATLTVRPSWPLWPGAVALAVWVTLAVAGRHHTARTADMVETWAHEDATFDRAVLTVERELTVAVDELTGDGQIDFDRACRVARQVDVARLLDSALAEQRTLLEQLPTVGRRLRAIDPST